MTALWRTIAVAARGPGAAWAVPLAIYAAGMALTFEGALWGPRSLGDNSDGGIALAILEHWVRVFTGQAADWRSPGWYWPAPHALGLSDSLFLVALPYAAARAAGAGWFLANDLAIASLATAGFWGMVLLVRRLGAPVAVGGVVAFVWSFGVVPVFKLGHLQTYTMQLAPMLGLMLVAAWRGAPGWAVAAGLLYGLMFLTAAQTPWFLGLEAGVALLAGAALGRVEWRRGARLVPPFALGLAAGMVPFLLLYRDSFGLVRDFSAAHFYSGWPRDLLNIPPGELMWSDLLHRVGVGEAAGRPTAEVALGLTPVLAVSGVVALVLTARRRAGAAALLAAGLLGPVLAVDWGWVEPWRLVFWWVPGGNAVRTPFRIELAAQFFLCLGLGLTLGRGVAHGDRRRWAGLAMLMALLLGEQVGDRPSGRGTAVMTAWLDAARRPAFGCEAFYLVPGGTGPWHQDQSDAMLLSQKLGLPTMNGNSSFYPEGWGMQFTERPGYAERTLAWIDAHGLRGRVCGSDPRRAVWAEGVASLEGRGR